MLAIGGVDSERKGSVELWDFAGHSAAVKDDKRDRPTSQSSPTAGPQKQLEQIKSLEDSADAEPKESEKRADLLRHAIDGYEQLYIKHRSQLLGVYSRFYQGRCLQKLGDHEQAQKIFEELLRLPDEPEAFQKLKASVRNRVDASNDKGAAAIE